MARSFSRACLSRWLCTGFWNAIRSYRKRKKDLLSELGIIPVVYCSPNHLDNEDTLNAAEELNFKYILTRHGFDYFLPGLIDFPPYKEKSLIVLPETKLGIRENPHVAMTYYDHLVDGKWEEFARVLERSTPLTEIQISGQPSSRWIVYVNKECINLYKKLRDFKTQFAR